MHLWGVGAGTGRRWTPPPPTPPSWLFFICLISVYCVPVRFYWASVFSGASLSDSIFFFPRPFLSLISLNFISSNEFVISPNLCMSSLWAFFMEGIASVNCFGLKKKLWWNTYFHSLPAFQRPFSGECSSLDGKFCCFLFFWFLFFNNCCSKFCLSCVFKLLTRSPWNWRPAYLQEVPMGKQV